MRMYVRHSGLKGERLWKLLHLSTVREGREARWGGGGGGGESKKWRKGRGVLYLFPTKEVAFLQRTGNVYLEIVATRGKGE